MRRSFVLAILATALAASTAHAQIPFVPFVPTPFPRLPVVTLNPDILEMLRCWPVGVKIDEIMVNVAQQMSSSEDAGEYIELYNTNDWAVDISHWTISDGADTDTFVDYNDGIATPGLTIPAHGYAVILDPDTDLFDDWAQWPGGDWYTYGSIMLDGDPTWGYDPIDPSKVIIVTVNDGAIGNGLKNGGGTITITTDRYVYKGNGAKQKLVLAYPNLVGKWYGSTYVSWDGWSYEECMPGEWFEYAIPSPGSWNRCD